jgi:hypothetical protein
LRILRSIKRLAVEKRRETYFLSNKEREKWIEDYVERETAVARKRVQDAQTAMMQKEEHIVNVENGRSITTKPEITFEEMLNAIGDSLRDLASSDNEADGDGDDDDEADTVHGKLSDDDEPAWVRCTISKMVQQRLESFSQKQLRLEELTQPGWGYAADYFRDRDMKYGTTELQVPAVGKPQADSTAATSSPTTFGELMQALDIVPGQSHMPQVTSRQGTSQMRLSSEIPQADNPILLPIPAAVPDSSPIEIAKPVQPVSFYRCIQRP